MCASSNVDVMDWEVFRSMSSKRLFALLQSTSLVMPINCALWQSTRWRTNNRISEPSHGEYAEWHDQCDQLGCAAVSLATFAKLQALTTKNMLIDFPFWGVRESGRLKDTGSRVPSGARRHMC